MSIDIKAALAGIQRILQALSQFTATKVDDDIAEGILVFMAHDEFLDWLQAKLDEPADVLAASAAPEGMALALEGRRIDWARLLEMLPTIITLIRAFAGK